MFSAIRVDGRRLYDLAREGKEVERAARRVVVHELELLEIALPQLRLRVRCSKGTYVRTLAHDLGEALGCYAHLSALRRTMSAGFRLEHARTLADLEKVPRDELAGTLLTENEALARMPSLPVDPTAAERVRHGRRLAAEELGVAAVEGQRFTVVSPDKELLAVAEWREGVLCYLRVLAAR